MYASVQFDRGELDLVLASLVNYGKNHPDQKIETDKLMRKIRNRLRRIEGTK